MTPTDEVKASLKSTLGALLVTARALASRVIKSLDEVESSEADWIALFKKLHAASARLPVRPWSRYYQRDLSVASEPLFVGIEDAPNEEHFGPIKQEFVNTLVLKYQTPATNAVNAVFDAVTDLFRETASRVLTLRYFSNSGVLLKRFEAILSPPWAKAIKVSGSPTEFRVPSWETQPVHEHPPHLEIAAVRSANTETLRILKHKLTELIATLETAVAELPFADRLKTPAPVPQTLIDYSTHIGEGSRIEGSAIGQASSKQS